MNDEIQLELARTALRKLSEDIDLSIVEQKLETVEVGSDKPKYKVIGVTRRRPIVITKDAFMEADKFLSVKTGKSKAIDPFEQPDGNAWTIVFNALGALRELRWSHQFALRYLDICYSLQVKHKTRIKKGSPHFWLSTRAQELNDERTARSQMILAFVEDSIDFPDPLAAPAAVNLSILFEIPNDELVGLNTYVKNQLRKGPPPLFAEEMLTSFMLSKISKPGAKKSILVSRIPLNQHVIRNWCKAIQTSPGGSGRSLEFLVAYLFQSVDGFQLMLRKRVRAGEVDIFVRNLASVGKPLPWIGHFVLIECKDTNEAVDTKELSHFVTKLSLPRIEVGIVVSKMGLTGRGQRRDAEGVRDHVYSRSGTAIIDLILKDLLSIKSADQLLQLLQFRYEHVRLGMAGSA